MTTQKKFAIDDLGAALVAACDIRTLAGILNAGLSAEADSRLSDYQVELLSRLFDRISELSPDAVNAAMGVEKATA